MIGRGSENLEERGIMPEGMNRRGREFGRDYWKKKITERLVREEIRGADDRKGKEDNGKR